VKNPNMMVTYKHRFFPTKNALISESVSCQSTTKT